MMAMMGGMGGKNQNPMMTMLLMKKFMGNSDSPKCFKKSEADSGTITTEEGTCLPKMELGQCGQETDPTQKETSSKDWTAVITGQSKTLHCGAVLVCSSWVITTASCLKQLASSGDLPVPNQARISNYETKKVTITSKLGYFEYGSLREIDLLDIDQFENRSHLISRTYFRSDFISK